METESSANNLSDAQLDSAYDAIENGSYNEPDVQETVPQQEVQAQTPAQEQAQQQYKFNYKGKEVAVDPNDPRFMQWLQQGYDYQNLVGQIRSQTEQFEAQRKAVEEKIGKYSQVDEWARSNPDQWQRVLALYDKAQQGQLTENQNTELLALEQRLTKQFENQLKPILDERQQRVYAEQDKALDSEIESVRKAYPDLDLEIAEEDGRTPMFKVLEFANQNGIKNFETAFKALYHDKLLQRAETKALEKITKERQKATKLGLLGKTPTPTKGVKPAQNYREKSYDDLFQEGVDELGAS